MLPLFKVIVYNRYYEPRKVDGVKTNVLCERRIVDSLGHAIEYGKVGYFLYEKAIELVEDQFACFVDRGAKNPLSPMMVFHVKRQRALEAQHREKVENETAERSRKFSDTIFEYAELYREKKIAAARSEVMALDDYFKFLEKYQDGRQKFSYFLNRHILKALDGLLDGATDRDIVRFVAVRSDCELMSIKGIGPVFCEHLRDRQAFFLRHYIREDPVDFYYEVKNS